jgi:hypothetical protein
MNGGAAGVILIGLCTAGLSLAGSAWAAGTRHWGIGWDGGSSSPLLRWRPTPGWDVTLTAGPNDDRSDEDTYRNSLEDSDQQVSLSHTGSRQESGWVALNGGRRVWSEGRFALASVLSVTANWTNSEDTYRRPFTSPADVDNQRTSDHYEAWGVAALLRPSFALSSRLSVEFEAGLRVAWNLTRHTTSHWYDVAPDFDRTEESAHETTFRTVGRFDWGYLKFVFWL